MNRKHWTGSDFCWHGSIVALFTLFTPWFQFLHGLPSLLRGTRTPHTVLPQGGGGTCFRVHTHFLECTKVTQPETDETCVRGGSWGTLNPEADLGGGGRHRKALDNYPPELSIFDETTQGISFDSFCLQSFSHFAHQASLKKIVYFLLFLLQETEPTKEPTNQLNQPTKSTIQRDRSFSTTHHPC